MWHITWHMTCVICIFLSLFFSNIFGFSFIDGCNHSHKSRVSMFHVCRIFFFMGFYPPSYLKPACILTDPRHSKLLVVVVFKPTKFFLGFKQYKQHIVSSFCKTINIQSLFIKYWKNYFHVCKIYFCTACVRASLCLAGLCKKSLTTDKTGRGRGRKRRWTNNFNCCRHPYTPANCIILKSKFALKKSKKYFALIWKCLRRHEIDKNYTTRFAWIIHLIFPIGTTTVCRYQTIFSGVLYNSLLYNSHWMAWRHESFLVVLQDT